MSSHNFLGAYLFTLVRMLRSVVVSMLEPLVLVVLSVCCRTGLPRLKEVFSAKRSEGLGAVPPTIPWKLPNAEPTPAQIVYSDTVLIWGSALESRSRIPVPSVAWWLCRLDAQTKSTFWWRTTVSGGSLGSCVDEERS